MRHYSPCHHVEQQRNVRHIHMLKFLHKKARRPSDRKKIKFEYPQSLKDVAGLLALNTPVFFISIAYVAVLFVPNAQAIYGGSEKQ